MKFGSILSDLRNKSNITQKELANILGVSRGTIGMYEIGQRDPDTETLKKLAQYFNVSIDYLLGNSDTKNSYASKDNITKSLNDDQELSEFWNVLKEREDLKLLFKQTKSMAPNDIKKIIRVIKAIEDEEDRNDG
jgi:transcriptional regulator with XRE-family HTH domain